MDFSNCLELFEAVYLFQKLGYYITNQNSKIDIQKSLVDPAINKALIKILLTNNLLEVQGDLYIQTDKNIEYQNSIMNSQNYINKYEYLEAFSLKAMNPNHNFFKYLDDTEYDIYSRWNFEVTYNIGKQVNEYLELNNCKVLELGGNSGGFATAIAEKSKKCSYTIIDNKIPCSVGNELKNITNLEIRFIENDIFRLNHSYEIYDYVILMNLIHDYSDEENKIILKNTKIYSDEATELIIIEDVLDNEFEPKEVILQGLRLSVECKGGKQRILEELVSLLSIVDYELVNRTKINNFQVMLNFKHKNYMRKSNKE